MGSSGGGASAAATQAEQERAAQVRAVQTRIESIFGSPERAKQITDFVAATRQLLQDELLRKQTVNARELKFSQARTGLSGGSAGAQQVGDLADAFLRASVEATRTAQGAGERLRASDQDAKLALFNQALGGLDMTTASNNALQAMRSNVGLAQSEASQSNLDQFFKSFADIYSQSKEAQGRRRTAEEFNTLYGARPYSILPVSGGSYQG